jgi:hypothetical protein
VRRLKESLATAASWKKLFRGEVKLGAAGGVMSRRLYDVTVSFGRRVARHLALPLKDDLATELRAAARHKIPLRFVFSSGEAGDQLLSELGGTIVETLRQRGGLSIERVEGADHTFTAVWAQRVFTERIDRWLGL